MTKRLFKKKKERKTCHLHCLVLPMWQAEFFLFFFAYILNILFKMKILVLRVMPKKYSWSGEIIPGNWEWLFMGLGSHRVVLAIRLWNELVSCPVKTDSPPGHLSFCPEGEKKKHILSEFEPVITTNRTLFFFPLQPSDYTERKESQRQLLNFHMIWQGIMRRPSPGARVLKTSRGLETFRVWKKKKHLNFSRTWRDFELPSCHFCKYLSKNTWPGGRFLIGCLEHVV